MGFATVTGIAIESEAIAKRFGTGTSPAGRRPPCPRGEVLYMRLADRSRTPDAAGAVVGIVDGGAKVDNSTGALWIAVILGVLVPPSIRLYRRT